MPPLAMRAALGAFLVLVVGAMKISEEAPMNPIQKVINVLNTLRNQVIEEGAEEDEAFAKHAKFCAVTDNEKVYQIAKSEKKIAGLAADISVLETKVAELTTTLNETDLEIAGLNNSLNQTKFDRVQEVARYDAAADEMNTAVSALARAMETMTTAQKSLVGKVGLAQLGRDASRVLDAAERVSFLQMSAEEVEALTAVSQKPGQAPGYNFKSGDVIAMLKGLSSTFKANKMTLDMTESENKLTYDKLMTDLRIQLKFNKQSFAENTLTKRETEAELSQTRTDHQDETDSKDADTAFLAALRKECKDKEELSVRRKEKRTEELALLKQAIAKTEAIPGSFVQQKGAKLLQREQQEADVSRGQSLSFLQVEEGRNEQSTPWDLEDVKGKTLARLSSESDRLHGGEFLALATERVKAVEGEDPFLQIRKVIKSLIGKLNKAAEDDQSNQEFCDSEIGKNTISRDDAQIKIENLNAQIDSANADKNKTTREVNDLNAQIEQTQSELAEATAIRANESAGNEAAIVANKAAADAVKASLDFYKNPAGFIQIKKEEPAVNMDAKDASGKGLADYAPKVADEEYAGGSQSAGVIGILEKVFSDFTKAHTEIRANEDNAVEDFEDYKSDSEKDIAAKQGEVADKEDKIMDLVTDLNRFGEDLSAEQDTLKIAKDELAKLKTICIDASETYEQKRQKRQQEIDSLKDTITYLNDLQEQEQAR